MFAFSISNEKFLLVYLFSFWKSRPPIKQKKEEKEVVVKETYI